MLLTLLRKIRSRIQSFHLENETDTTRWELNFCGLKLTVYDAQGSRTCPAVFKEIIRNELGLLNMKLNPNATIVDIGANIGIPAIYLAKKYPSANIYAFEPVKENYDNLKRNIETNKVTNIIAINKAITGDGRTFDMTVALNDNSGGATGQVSFINEIKNTAQHRLVESTTLDAVFTEHKIKQCDLLKIDCEGSEHEILESFKNLSLVKKLIGEIHLNSHLEKMGYSFEKILKILEPMGRRNYQVKCIRMAE